MADSRKTPVPSGVFRGGGLVRGPPPLAAVGRTAVIFVTILGLFLAPFKDKIAATSDQMRFFYLKCSKMRLRPGLRPGPHWGSAPPALPTSC